MVERERVSRLANRRYGVSRQMNGPPDVLAIARGEAPRPVAGSPVMRLECRHLGSETRQQDCPTCKGNVRLKVFGCAVHGECTIDTAQSGVACCGGCGDYAAGGVPSPGGYG